jgi:MFS family permease
MVYGAVLLLVMPYFTSLGLSEGPAAFAAMFIPLSSIAGRVCFGWLGDLVDKRFLIAVALFLQAVGLIFFCSADSLWYLIPFLFFYGTASGGMIVLRAAISRDILVEEPSVPFKALSWQ